MSASASLCSTPLPKRAALYARVSTGDQDLEIQVRDLGAYAKSRGWSVDLISRETVSGSGRKARPEFDRLGVAVQVGTLDIVRVVKLDRIARSVREALAFFEEAEANGVRVVVTTQDSNTRAPAGWFTRTILAGAAELEGEIVREQTRAATAAIKAGTRPTKSDRLPGRPKKVTEAAVAKARERWRMNHRWAEIARATGPKAETIRRAVGASIRADGSVGSTSSGRTAVPSGGGRAGG